jgi:predicted aconitase
MELTETQRAMLDGAEGPELRLALETLVNYGKAFGARRLVPIKSAHFTGSFAISVYRGYYELLDRLVRAGVRVRVPTTINPRPGRDFSLPNRLLAFRRQLHHEAQLARLGVTPNYSCVCYMEANVPQFGDVLGWAESSAVIYANSVIGARTNRNSVMMDVCMAVTGLTPEFGLLLDENRRGGTLVKLDVDRMDAAALGYLVGRRLVDRVPVLEHYPFNRVQLKNMGAAMAAAGGVGLFHVVGVTPEAPTLEAVFDGEPAETIMITQRDLDALRAEPPLRQSAEMVVFGCPQMTLDEVHEVGRHFVGKKAARRVLFHVVPADLERLKAEPLHAQLLDAGVELHAHCPLAGLSLRLSPWKKNMLTPSGKLHYYLEGADYGTLDDALCAAGVKE